MQSPRLILPLLLLPLLVPSVAGRGLTVPLVNYDVRCFMEDLSVGDEMFVHFQVTEGRHVFESYIKEPDGEVLFSTYGEDHLGERRVYLVAQKHGTYRVCLDNSGGTYKRVFLSVRVLKKQGDGKAAKEDPISRTLGRITESLNSISEDQQFLHTRERVHMDTTHSLSSRVFWSSVLQVILMVGVGFGQLWYLRSLFFTPTQRRGV